MKQDCRFFDGEQLPKGWLEIDLGSVCHARGGTFSPQKEGSNTFELYSIPSFETGQPEIVKANDIGSSKQYVETNDVLLSKINPRLNRAWIVGNYSKHDKIASTEWIVFQKNNLIIPKFLQYVLTDVRLRDYLSHNASGVGGSLMRVKLRLMDNVYIGLPPKPEQHRISVKLDELFSEIDKALDILKTAREQLKVYYQAVLKHAFEGKLTASWREENKDKLEPPNQLLTRIQAERDTRYWQDIDNWKEAIKEWEVTGTDPKPSKPRKPDAVNVADVSKPVLPEGWVWGHLGNLNTDVFDGPFGSNLKTSDYVHDGVRVIRLENIGYLKFIDDKVSYIAEEKFERLKKHTVRAGDIIFSSFVIDGIRLAILPDTIGRAVNKADCFCVRLHDESVRTDYAASFLSMRTAFKQIESEIHGIGRPRINTAQLKTFAIPLCSRAEQDEIMSQLSEKLSLTDNIDVSIKSEVEKCDVLRQSILKKAFSGKLVAQDTHDEPASVLLERIKGTAAA